MKKKIIRTLAEEHYAYAYSAAYHAAIGDRITEGKCREAINAIHDIIKGIGLKEGIDYTTYRTTKTACDHEITFFAMRAII